LNGTHQHLFFVDDVDLFDKYINTRKKNTDSLLGAMKRLV